MARESQCPLSDGPPEPRDGLDGPLEPHGPGRRWLGRTSRRGVRKESESLKPAAAPFCVQLLGRTEAPPFGPPRAPQRRERHPQKDGTPTWLRGSSPRSALLRPSAHRGTLRGRTDPGGSHGRGSRGPVGDGAGRVLLGEGCLTTGQKVDRAGDALLSLPEHPGARRNPTPGPRPGGGSGKEGVAGGAWQGHRGLSASLPLPRGACALGEGGSQAEAAFPPCARAPGLLPARVPLSRVSGGHVGPASPAGARPLRRRSPRDTASPG